MSQINARLSRDGKRVLVSVSGGQWLPANQLPWYSGGDKCYLGNTLLTPEGDIRYEYQKGHGLGNRAEIVERTLLSKVFIQDLLVYETDLTAAFTPLEVLQKKSAHLQALWARQNREEKERQEAFAAVHFLEGATWVSLALSGCPLPAWGRRKKNGGRNALVLWIRNHQAELGAVKLHGGAFPPRPEGLLSQSRYAKILEWVVTR